MDAEYNIKAVWKKENNILISIIATMWPITSIIFKTVLLLATTTIY